MTQAIEANDLSRFVKLGCSNIRSEYSEEWIKVEDKQCI
jgi:hypothetical protein